MSYDIELKDPATKQVLHLPYKHLMHGGTYQADYDPDTGKFTPVAISEAHLNITYNYAEYYYLYDKENGIRTIYGKSGADSIPILDGMIDLIQRTYKQGDIWKDKTTSKIKYFNNGKEIDFHTYMLLKDKSNAEKIEQQYTVSEGDVSNYWEATAANALRPLYQLKAMAQLRPDGIWEGD